MALPNERNLLALKHANPQANSTILLSTISMARTLFIDCTANQATYHHGIGEKERICI